MKVDVDSFNFSSK